MERIEAIEQRRTAASETIVALAPCVLELWNPLLTKRLCHRARERSTAAEARRLIDAAGAFVTSHLRIGAKRARALDAITRHPGRNDLRGWRALLDPVLHRGERVEMVRP